MLSSPLPRRYAARGVKGLHTVLFAIISTCVLEVFRAGWLGRPTRATRPAIAVVLAESAVYAGFGLRCPLTGLAERWGEEKGRVTDIFLPRWFADRIPQIYTPLFVAGLLGLALRRSAHTPPIWSRHED